MRLISLVSCCSSSANETVVPGFNINVTVTLTPFTVTSTGKRIGAGLLSSAMRASVTETEGRFLG
jgi:hypothetical protein